MSQAAREKVLIPSHKTQKETLDKENPRAILEVEESWRNELWEQLRKGGSRQTSFENSAPISNLECRSEFSMDMNDLNPFDL